MSALVPASASGVALLNDVASGVIGTAPDEPCGLTIIRSHGAVLAKMIAADGTVTTPSPGLIFDMVEVPINGLADALQYLRDLQGYQGAAVIRGRPASSPMQGVRRLKNAQDGSPATIHDVPRRLLILDVDGLPLPEGVSPHDLAACARAAIETLPAPFRGARVIAQFTGSHLFKPGCRLRLWVWLSRPLSGNELKAWLAGTPVDNSVFDAIEPIFTAPPYFADGRADPIPQRIIDIPGHEMVTVPTYGEMWDLLSRANDTAANGPPPEPAELAAPSVDAIVNLLAQTPNPEAFNREKYIDFGYAINGARTGLKSVHGLDQKGEDRIAAAWAEWAKRWTPPAGHEAGDRDTERQKWCSDLGQPTKDVRYSGWRQFLELCQEFGAPEAALRDAAMDRAQDTFTAELAPLPDSTGRPLANPPGNQPAPSAPLPRNYIRMGFARKTTGPMPRHSFEPDTPIMVWQP